MLHRNATLASLALMAVAAIPAFAQDSSPKVGDIAPEFNLPGSTKEGLLSKPLRLRDFRGQVVVIAFFPKARTKG
jgi:peroxiredoxin Q/BCP